MAKEARGQYINGEAVYYRDDNTRKMVSQDAFSEIKKYVIGDYCIYENTLYKFIADKEAGAWNASAVEAVTVTEELGELNNKVTINEEDINSLNENVEKLNSSVTIELSNENSINSMITNDNIGKTFNIHLPSDFNKTLTESENQGWGYMSILTDDVADLCIIYRTTVIVMIRWTKSSNKYTTRAKLTGTSY